MVRRIEIVKLSVPAFILLAATSVTVSFAQAPGNEPTKQEVERAYRSRGGGSLISRARWRIQKVRGWTLEFSHVQDEKYTGVVIAKYLAVAKKNGLCAEYHIADTVIFTQPNPQMKPMLVVDSEGLKACR